MPKGPYQDVRFTDFSGGLATKIEDNKINDNQSPDLQNIIFDGGGSFLPRTGNKLFGAATSATGSISRTWTTQNSQGIDVSMRMVDDTSTQYLEYYNPQTSAWENLDTGFTTGQEFGVAYYDFYIYWSSPKDYMRRWNGIVWSTSTYADSAYSRIDLSTSAASALGFLSAGSVVIDGEEVYYSSYSGTALSGITFTTAHNGGVGIAQLPTSAGETPAPDGGWVSAASSIPHGSMMYEQDAQLFVAGLSSSLSAYNSNVVWYSAVDEPTNFTISAVPGGGGSARYPETTGGIKALNSFNEDIAILKANTIRKLHFAELADGTAGSIEIVSRTEVTTGANIGATNNEAIATVENDFIYVTPAGWIKSIASNTDKGLNIEELSKVIRPTVESLDMSKATGVYFAGKYHLACAVNGSAINNVVYVFDYDFKSWTRYIGWNVADWFINNGILYFGASNEIATYQAYINYDDNDGAYETYWKSKWMDFGVPNEEKRLNQVYVEGYMTANTTVGVSAYFDGDINAPRPKSIKGTGSYISSTDNITVIGSVIWGSGVYGGGTGGSQYNLKKFRVNLKFAAKDFYNMQLKIGTSSPGYVYKITHVVPYLAPISGKRIPTNNII